MSNIKVQLLFRPTYHENSHTWQLFFLTEFSRTKEKGFEIRDNLLIRRIPFHH
jgi:hypothetical protein